MALGTCSGDCDADTWYKTVPDLEDGCYYVEAALLIIDSGGYEVENLGYSNGVEFSVGDVDCSGGGDITFVCGNGSEIPFNLVNDGYGDCADGADEQQYDTNGTEINWFDCHDGSQVWIHQVNDGTDDCPDAEDEGDVSAAEDDMDCAESDLQMSLHYDAAGDIYFEMTMDCAFSQEDSDDMRAMYDLYFGDGDGILN